MNIGANLQKARKRKNLSQEDAAIKLDVTRQCVSLWENDQTAPTLDNLVSLSNLYGLSISILMGQEPFPEDAIDPQALKEIKEEEIKEQKRKEEIANAEKSRKVGIIIALISAFTFILPGIGIVGPIIALIMCSSSYKQLKDFKSLSFMIISIIYIIASVVAASTGMFLNVFSFI